MRRDEILHDLGFSKNEAQVYLTLLRTGANTAGTIAAHAKIHRTNVYDALDRLVEKGAVTYIFKGNKKYFEAGNPTTILELLKDRTTQFESNILPTLQLDYKLSKETNKAHIFEGMQGIKTITNDMLREGKEICVFGIPKDVAQRLKSFIDVFHKRRIEKKMDMYHLYDANAKERIEHLNSLPYTEAKYLPHNAESPATTLIYGNKIAFNIWSDPPISILIESEKMAEQYRNYFRYLYKTAKGGKK